MILPVQLKRDKLGILYHSAYSFNYILRCILSKNISNAHSLLNTNFIQF